MSVSQRYAVIMWSGIFWSVDCVVLFVSMVHIKHSAAEWLNFTLFRHGNPFQIWWGRSLNELFTRLSFQGEFSRNEENHEKAKVISRCASIFCLLVAVWLNEIQIIYDYIIRHSPHGSWHATRTFWRNTWRQTSTYQRSSFVIIDT